MSDPTTPQTYPQRLFRLPPTSKEIVLVRHGASLAHVPGEVHPLTEDGHGDPPLAPEGEEQARLVGERLALEPIRRIFVTTLRRTHQTAAPLVERLGLEPTVVHDLREIHLGDWDGGEYRARIADRDPIIVRSFVEGRWDVIPGAENDEAFGERVWRGFQSVVDATDLGTLSVAVVHGGVVAEICRRIIGPDHGFAFLGCDNTSITRIVVHPEGHLRVRTFNDSAHLDRLRLHTEEELV
ncbi:MAG: histidine phosphatase family protein [Solirubrobacteraceae bacterium]|nr:histidine phosphatase family protein [Solirubrobacteraceae bacterium]